MVCKVGKKKKPGTVNAMRRRASATIERRTVCGGASWKRSERTTKATQTHNAGNLANVSEDISLAIIVHFGVAVAYKYELKNNMNYM